MVALGNHERRDILRDAGAAADHDVCADNAELMDCRHAADDNEIIQRDMAGERGIVGQNTAVSDLQSCAT